jgi:hypothetical protein
MPGIDPQGNSTMFDSAFLQSMFCCCLLESDNDVCCILDSHISVDVDQIDAKSEFYDLLNNLFINIDHDSEMCPIKENLDISYNVEFVDLSLNIPTDSRPEVSVYETHIDFNKKTDLSLDNNLNDWDRVLDEHRNNVETRLAMAEMGATLITFGYYGVSTCVNPFATVPLLAFKSLRYFSKDVDDFCKENESVFGYSVCDVLEIGLNGYSAYSISSALQVLQASKITKFTISFGMTVVGKTVSQSLTKDNRMLPAVDRYEQNLAYEMTVELVEVGVNILFPNGGMIVKPLSVGTGQVVKELTKHGHKDFESSEVTVDTIKTITCKAAFNLLPPRYGVIGRFQLDVYCKNVVEMLSKKVLLNDDDQE